MVPLFFKQKVNVAFLLQLSAGIQFKNRNLNPTAMPSSKQFQVFFDGDCPLCQREINWLRKKDRNKQIDFIDIAADSFDEITHGKPYDTLMAQIHGRDQDGNWITGVEVFRRLYQAAGYGGLVKLTRLPVIKQGLDIVYRVFAKYRTRLTGRFHANGNACLSNQDDTSAE